MEKILRNYEQNLVHILDFCKNTDPLALKGIKILEIEDISAGKKLVFLSK